jgi:hypothetical protein
VIGGILQTMVNVNSPNLSRPLMSAGPKQCRGIGAAAESNGQGQLRLKAVGQQAHDGATRA